MLEYASRGGVCLVLGGSLPGPGGGLPGPGGSAWSGGRGVCLVPRGGLPGPGGGDGIPACTEADTLPPPVDRHTPVKTLP